MIGDNRHLHKALVQLVRPDSGSGEKLGQAQDIEEEKKNYDKSCKKTEFKTPVIRYISANIECVSILHSCKLKISNVKIGVRDILSPFAEKSS